MATPKKTASKTAARKSGRPDKKVATKKKTATTKKAESTAKPSAPARPSPPARHTAPAKPSAPAKSGPAARGKTGAKESPTSAPTSRPAAPPKRARSGRPRTVAVTVGSAVASKLGTKWSCFQCGAKFYDLNKPEPLCPKCGADQRRRPKVSPNSPQQPPPQKRPPRPIAPLLDDEDDGSVRYEEEFDLGVRTEPEEGEEELFPPGELEDEEPLEEE